MHIKKQLLAVLLSLLILAPLYAQPPGNSANWNLVFEDNFTGTSLDQSKWGYNYPWGRTHNHRAYMTESMVTVQDGFLNIKAINQRHPDAPAGTNQYESSFGYLSFDYTSGAIHSKGKFETTYGYIEGRFKAPSTPGTWPAFWTLNADGAWPPEIDILEIPDERRVHHYYYHYGPDWQNERSFGATHTGVDKSQGFHNYGVEWGPNYMKFYFDGVLVNSYTNRPECSQGKNMYLLINLAIDGWAPTPPANATWPANYQCDWVRVYKANPTANYDFETGSLSPWGAWNNATLTSDCKRSGNFGVKLTGAPVSIERTVILEPNTKYVFGGYGRVNTAGESVMFGVKNYGGTQIVKQIRSSNFVRDSVVFTTGASNTSAVVFFYKEAGSGTACGDDFFLYKANTNLAPTISITSPANNTSYTTPANITFSASASDADGTISNVAFYNGSTLLGTDATAPYSFTWNNVPAGTYSLTARATDNAGATTSSSTTTIVVNAACTPTAIAPYTQINGGSWVASSTAAVKVGDQVKFGPQPLSGGTWSWQGPNGFASALREITLSNLQSNQKGNYIATYKNTGGCISTHTFSLIVDQVTNKLPAVNITSPIANQSFTAPANITIAANASDADGTISNVTFYNGAAVLGSDANAPYSFNWVDVPAGSYSLTAKATDNQGAVTTSNSIVIVVNTVTSSNETILGPSCAEVNASIALELNSTKRTGATSYSWWSNASTESISPIAGTPYKVEVNTGRYFNGGEICVGVNYNTAPYYSSFCKNLPKCSSSVSRVAMIGPNPSSEVFTVIAEERIAAVQVIDLAGKIVFNYAGLAKEELLEFGERLPSGLYTLTIIYEDGKVEIRSIQKL